MGLGEVSIPPELEERLQLTAWNSMSSADQKQVAQQIADLLLAAGYDFVPLGLHACGPDDDPQIVSRWRDRATGMEFSLVPGGSFRPGFDDHLMRRYWEIQREMVAWQEEPPEHEAPYLCRAPWTPARLAQWERDAACPPLLMACVPLLPSVPGALTCIGPSRYRILGDTLETGPLHFFWAEVQTVLAEYRWTLPSSAEFEWALRGGIHGLFYWGNEMPEGWWTYDLDEFARDFLPFRVQSAELRPWPQANRFGLIGMVSWATWCAPPDGPDPDSWAIVRGGAGACYPWQACGEWLLMLNACELKAHELRDSHRMDPTCTIRPVIRLMNSPEEH
jgi:hypothetical protein